MTDDPTHPLAREPLAGRTPNTNETSGGRDLAASMIGVAFTALRHEVEASDASARAQSRARASLRSFVARIDDAPHAADRLISELGPTPREVTLARENPDAMATLAEARATAVAMAVESGVTTIRGQLDFAIASRMRTIAVAMLDDPERAAAAGDMIAKAASLQDRAVDADARIRTQQREQRQRAEWEQRSQALVVAEPLEPVDVSELDDRKSIYDRPSDDAIEHARDTIARLQGRKVELGLAFVDPRDDCVTIRPRSQPHPHAADALAKVQRSARGTSPFDRGAQLTRRLSASELAERGIYSDSVIDSHPMAMAEAELQAAEREAREREFPKGIGRLSGIVPEWRPQYREPEPAPWEQLAQLRAAPAEDDDHDDHDDDDDPEDTP